MKSRILKAMVLSLSFLTASRVLAAESAGGFDLKLVAGGFVSPSTLAPVPNSGGTLLVADQAGVIYLLNKEGQVAPAPFLDLRSKLTKLNQGFDERGLLGLALHPRFANNKKLYVVYSAPKRAGAPEDWDHTMRLAEFTASETGQSARLDSEKVILEIDKPYFNHNGGMIAFGPDGLLYMSTGDGGNGNDQGRRPPEGNGQNLRTLLGKMLRIDVDKGDPYSIPEDNPFVSQEGVRPEIYAYGLRNPWRFSIDRFGNHEIFVGDVGQDGYEEVDIIVKGGNYGWNLREGFHCFDPKNPTKAPKDCPKVGARGEPLLDPILEYKNFKAHPRDPEAKGISITGGYVYRGNALPDWQGKYIFADWSAAWVKPLGVLFAATRGIGGQWTWQTIKPASTPLNFYITGFGQDSEGELYVLANETNGLSTTGGKVFKIVPL